MIIFDLCCDLDHRFEGWFRSAEDFEAQLEQNMVSCPQCDSHLVRRVPSAVAIGGASPETDSKAPARRPAAAQSTTMMPTPSQMQGLYRQMMTALLATSEDVGEGFAEEARRIHYNEAPERAIHGTTTPEEREALHEEGIAIVSLPAVAEDDLN